MSATVKWSYSRRISSTVQPRASKSMTNSTDIRVPPTIGFATRTFGSAVIGSCEFNEPPPRQGAQICLTELYHADPHRTLRFNAERGSLPFPPLSHPSVIIHVGQVTLPRWPVQPSRNPK